MFNYCRLQLSRDTGRLPSWSAFSLQTSSTAPAGWRCFSWGGGTAVERASRAPSFGWSRSSWSGFSPSPAPASRLVHPSKKYERVFDNFYIGTIFINGADRYITFEDDVIYLKSSNFVSQANNQNIYRNVNCIICKVCVEFVKNHPPT